MTMRVQFAMAGNAPQHHEFGEALLKFWPVITGFGVAAWALLRSAFLRADASAKAKAQLQVDLEGIAKGAVASAFTILQGENTRLSKRVEDLEQDFAKLTETSAALILSKDGEISMLRGEIRGILSTALSYQAKLEAAGLPHEKISPHYWDVSGFQIREVPVS